jgi:tetratricopeptide (TPR) repeat protein
LPDNFKKAMSEGGKQSAVTLPSEIIKSLEAGGSYKLLRIHEVDGEVRALFRLLSEAGVNYHDIVLIARKDGDIAIADVHIAIAGEFMSQTIKRFMFQTIALDPKKIQDPGEIPQEILASAKQLAGLAQMASKQQFAELLKEWQKLPDAMKKDKGVFMFRFIAAQALMDKDPDGYANTIEDYQKLFPNDPTSDLILIDTRLIKKQFKELHESFNRIDKAIGPDAYINVLRAIAYKEEKKFAEAKLAGEKAVKAEPELGPAYDILLLISVETKKYDHTVYWLTEIEKRFNSPLDEALMAADFEDFRKSAEYKLWSEGRKKKAAP